MAAIRLSLCIGIAAGAKWYFPFSHWFWVPLTVCLVMKPDFGSVFDRAILRVFGTVVGAAIATFVILLVPKGAWIGVAIGVLSALVPWFMARSYALQAVAIAPSVILLVDIISPGDGSANYSWQRIGATLIGGVIVIVFGYLVWPRSRRASTEASVRVAVGHIADQLRAAGTPLDAGDQETAELRHEQIVSSRRAAYSGLADVRVRLQRAMGEPPPACDVAASWLPVVETAERLADAVTAYAGARLEGRVTEDPAGAEDLAERLRVLVGDRTGPAVAAVPTAHVPESLDAVEVEVDHLQRLLTLEPIRA